MKKRLLILVFILSAGTLFSEAQICGKHIFTATSGDFPRSYYPYTKRDVFENNGAKLILAHEGDTYEAIAAEINITENDIRKYNDVTDWKYEPCIGEVVYLTPKKNKCSTQFHKIESGESMRGISQKYGVTLKALYDKNIKHGVPLLDLRSGDVICISCK